MKAIFNIESQGQTRSVEVPLQQLIVAGWAGRDLAAIEHHIEELAELGVPRPSSVPLYYRIGQNQFTQEAVVQVVGPHSSGEIEALVFQAEGQLCISIASDHTDRKLEAHSVALSKQVCAKPAARDAWLYADVANHIDELVLRSWIVEDGERKPYQDGPMATLRTPEDLIAGYLASTGAATFAEGSVMTCGTVGAIGGIRPSNVFEMELHDPVLQRSLRHRYEVQVLPEVA
ncbi:DUF2848 domain-containing protein [Comamonas antarctica]|uniref:DUF2848 domain-containing protein n=1 Tax=Comamonas antarctica TaxID=2743470 RepID=A0A6N1X367_9BURK|nr:DUF2848 domain-containing protein [Comamonas antarctica]QKV52190.1 DUF2848 domain-containing protein [Comamonas antarctica]